MYYNEFSFRNAPTLFDCHPLYIIKHANIYPSQFVLQ